MLAILGFLILFALGAFLVFVTLFIGIWNSALGWCLGDTVATVLIGALGCGVLWLACHLAPFTITWVG